MPPVPERYVINWFGFDIRYCELFAESQFQHWKCCLGQLAVSMNLRVERFGSVIDVIVGKSGGSISRKEFFSFQTEWDELNERLGFHMSGALWLGKETGGLGELATWECYHNGRKELGDSIGRSQKHLIKAIRTQSRQIRHEPPNQ